MNAADAPRKIVIPWAAQAASSYVHSVPDAGTSGDTNASFQQGFPPKTFQPVGSGGAPVDGGDMNGALLALSAVARWAQDGGMFPFDAAYATSIGGYRKGAMLQSSVTAGLIWQSTADANSTNPDSSGSANWTPLGASQILLGNNGYRIGADGFIEQWGVTVTPSGGTAPVAFLVSFPNACVNVQATNAAGGPPTAWPGVGGLSKTGFTLYSSTASGVGPSASGVTHFWRAIGN